MIAAAPSAVPTESLAATALPPPAWISATTLSAPDSPDSSFTTSLTTTAAPRRANSSE